MVMAFVLTRWIWRWHRSLRTMNKIRVLELNRRSTTAGYRDFLENFCQWMSLKDRKITTFLPLSRSPSQQRRMTPPNYILNVRISSRFAKFMIEGPNNVFPGSIENRNAINFAAASL